MERNVWIVTGILVFSNVFADARLDELLKNSGSANNQQKSKLSTSLLIESEKSNDELKNNKTLNDTQTGNDIFDLQQQAPQKKPKQNMRDEAFKQLINKTFPLRPDQIIEYKRYLNRNQQAINTHPTLPPQPVTSTLKLELSPGTTAPVIRLAQGFVSSIVFLDSTGQPWPVADFSVANNKINVQWDSKTNTLFMQSTGQYVTANMAIRLVNLETPIMLSLISDQREIDFRVDLQVPGRGPNALASIVQEDPSHVHNALLQVLDGVPPLGSIEMKVSEENCRVWNYANKIYVRTKFALLSPAWVATVSSADGTKVYELQPTPLVLLTKHGVPTKVFITE